MKLYVINLDRSHERLSRIQTLFNRLGLTITRIDAVDALTLSDEQLQSAHDSNEWPEPMTRGEIACFLSHKRAIEAIAQGEDTFATIFEDDVTLSQEAPFFLNTADWIPEDADIIKIETHYKKLWLGEAHTTGRSDFQLRRLKSTHILAAAYIISKKAAQKLLAQMDSVSAPIDHWLFNARLPVFSTLTIYQLDPAIVVQAGLQSTLEKDRVIYNNDKKRQRSLSQTLTREIKRIFKRSAIGLKGIWINLGRREKWKRVPFRP